MNYTGTRVNTADKYDQHGRRLCTSCGVHKTVDAFGRQTRSKDGLDVGMITADPEHWREGLAGLLRDLAAEIAGETTGEPCPADG